MDISNASESELQRLKACENMPKKNIILLGPPGSGKGTQSGKLIHDFCYCQLSTGDLLRDNVARRTPEGIRAKQAMDAGQLVSDEIVNSIIVNAIRSPACSRGIIFDGYPRNEEQAANLENLLKQEGRNLDNVIELKVDEELLYERIEGRRVHLPSGRTYHLKFNPPKVDGVDDITGEPLVHRNDDKREVMQSRIEIYNKKTAPVAEFYKKHGILSSIDAMQPIEKNYNNIKNILI